MDEMYRESAHNPEEANGASGMGYQPQHEQDVAQEMPQTKLASVWSRQCARIIDYSLITIPLFIFLIVIMAVGGVENISKEASWGIDIALSWIYVFLEGVSYSLFGNTFGKWLCGVRVVDKDGVKIDAGNYMTRNFRFLLHVLWLGLPIGYLIGAGINSKKIEKGLPTNYDAPHGVSVIEYNRTPLKAFISSLLGAALIVLNVYLVIQDRINP